jgi:hypothetical protein
VRLARRLLAPALAALGLAGALGLAAGPAKGADTVGAPPTLATFGKITVDSAAKHIFVSDGVNGTSGITVTDLAGDYVATIDQGDAVTGMALSPDGTELYASLAGQDAVAEIDPVTLTQTATYSLGTGNVPHSLATQSGKVWVSYQNSAPGSPGLIGHLMPGTTTSFEADPELLPGGNFWSEAPELAADPLDGGTLVAATPGQSPPSVATFSLSGTPAVLDSSPGFASCGSESDIAVMPGGAQFIMACPGSTSDALFSTATLSGTSVSYPSDTYPAAVAVSPGGAVATGASRQISAGMPGTPDVNVYAPGGPTLRNPYTFDSYLHELAFGGLAWSSDGSLLAVATHVQVQNSTTSTYSLQVISNPLLTMSTLSLGGTSNATPAQPVTINGQLTLSTGVPPAGTTITVTRTEAGGSVAPATFTATTAADGSFSVSDTALPAGAYTYTASYAGDSATAAAAASTVVTVALSPSALWLNGPTTDLIDSPVTLTGNLMVAGSLASGDSVTITRANPGGSVTSLPSQQTDVNGAFSLTDTPPATGTYTYTASYAGDADTSPAQATAQVTVSLYATTLTLSGPSRVLPGKGFSISGAISFATGSITTGSPITITRKNPNGTTTTLPGLTTAPTGFFTITDKLSALGTYTYTARYAGTAITDPATSTLAVTVAKGTPELTLTAGAPTALYDSTIKVTAHLGTTNTNHTVSVYAQLAGSGVRRLLKTATVNGSGNLVISYPAATRNVIFTAAFSGDALYNARSVSMRVGVDARVVMMNSGWYTTTKFNGTTFQVFHHTGHLNVAVTVTPNKRGETVELLAQQWFNNTWNNVAGDLFRGTLNSSSKISGYLTLAGVTGDHFRLIAVFVPSSKDVTNVSYHSGWFYFSVVK